MTRKITQAGREMIKGFEGIMDGDPSTVNLDPYLCPSGVWTIGWGHSITYKNGRQIRGLNNKAKAYALFPDGITMEQAEELLSQDLVIYEDAVERLVKVDLNENQFAALVSFCFNIGATAFNTSTLLKKLNAGDYNGAAAELPKWVKGFSPKTGKKEALPGLVKRREAERLMFMRPLFVAPKPLMKTSRIKGSILTGIGGVGALAMEALPHIDVLHEKLHGYGFDPAWLGVVFATIVLIGTTYMAFTKVRDRVFRGDGK